MTPLVAIFAATVVSLLPIVWFELYKRTIHDSSKPLRFTASLLIVLPGLTGLVLLSVPFAPEIKWRTPGIIDIGLMFATSPLLWGLAICIGILSKVTGVVIQTADINPWQVENSENMPATSGPSPWIAIPVGALVGGAEELLFRGVVLIWLVDGVGIVSGLLLNGVLFGLYHYPNSVDSFRAIDGKVIQEMSISGAGGVILGLLYLGTGNLLVSLVGHALHNAGLFYLLYARSDS